VTSNLATTTPSSNTSLISTAEPIDDLRHRDLLAVGASIVQVSFVGVAIFIFMIGKAKYKMIDPSGKGSVFASNMSE
jgi:hypothetical protein